MYGTHGKSYNYETEKKLPTHTLRALCINICLNEMNMTTYE